MWNGGKRLDAAAAREAALWLLVPSLGLISHTYAPLPPVLLFFAAAFPLAWYGLDVHLHAGSAGGTGGIGGLRPGVCTPDALCPALRVWRPFFGWVALYIGYMLVGQYLLGTSLRSTWGVICSACYGLLPLLLWRGGASVSAAHGALAPDRPDSVGQAAVSAAEVSVGSSENLFVRHRRKFDWAFRVALAVYTIEAAWRYGMAWLSSEPSVYQGIYRYKFGGLMYSESNATGIHILIWLFFTLWWARALWRRGLLSGCRDKARYIGMAVWWLVLLGLTLSRACWIAAVIGLLYFCMPVKRIKYIWISLSVCLFAAVAAFVFFVYPPDFVCVPRLLAAGFMAGDVVRHRLDAFRNGDGGLCAQLRTGLSRRNGMDRLYAYVGTVCPYVVRQPWGGALPAVAFRRRDLVFHGCVRAGIVLVPELYDGA